MNGCCRFIYSGQLSASSNSSTNSNSSSSSSASAAAVKSKSDGKDAKKATAASAKVESKSVDSTQLLAAADRFQVADLVELCIEQLSSSLSVENLADRLILADKCNAPALIERCLDFIRADPSRLADVRDSDGYQHLDKAQMDLLLSAFALPSKKRARPADLAADPDLQPPANDAIKRMKLSELKEKLAEKGLETSGLKADLVERLINALHGRSVVAGSSVSSGSSSNSRAAMSDA